MSNAIALLTSDKSVKQWRTVLLNTARAAGQSTGLEVGDRVPVQRRPDGNAYLAVRDLGPNEVLVLTNRP